jgi:hypothetical protein
MGTVIENDITEVLNLSVLIAESEVAPLSFSLYKIINNPQNNNTQ